jgi:tetratricopeptide (TPR) repeat protein
VANKTRAGLPVFVGMALLLVAAAADDAIWEKLHERGMRSEDRGDYATAERHFRAAVVVAKKFGERDPRLGHITTDLAWSLYHQGRYAEAEPVALESLAIRQAAFGESHVEFAYALDALAAVLHARGRYAESESLRKRSISIFPVKCAASTSPFR